MTPADTTICVFGLGEAGSAIAADLARRDVTVTGFDPAEVATPTGVTRFDDPTEAVVGCDFVLAVTAAADSEVALRQAFDVLPAGCTYADLATAAPALKRRLGDLAGGGGVAFADVALMGTVADRGLRTPALASGPGAAALTALLGQLGMPIRVVGEEPGRAASHKLVRSVAIKGLTAVLIESLRAAHAAGIEESTWGDLVTQVTAADEAFMRRLIAGTGIHATRRIDEMAAAVDLLDELGVPNVMTTATLRSLQQVGALGLPELPPPQ